MNVVEYILSEGNLNVILCERGIRIFEIVIRNILDILVIFVVKEKSYFLIIVDLSYVVGKVKYVLVFLKVVIVVGVDGFMIEVYLNL